MTLGHEFSGTITEVGEGVTRLHVGDNVAIKPNLFDGGCAACLGGWVNCCDNLGFVGFSGMFYPSFSFLVLVLGVEWCLFEGLADYVQVVLGDCRIMLLSRRIGP